MGILIRSLKEGDIVALWMPIYAWESVWKKIKNPTFLSFGHQLVKDAIIFLVQYVQSAL